VPSFFFFFLSGIGVCIVGLSFAVPPPAHKASVYKFESFAIREGQKLAVPGMEVKQLGKTLIVHSPWLGAISLSLLVPGVCGGGYKVL
jgi:hypothetical protein